MNFTLSAEIYVRLAGITKIMPENVTEEQRQVLKTVRVEVKNGHGFAIGTNMKTAAIYYLGKIDIPDDHVNIIVDNALIAQCENEMKFNGNIEVSSNRMLEFATVKTTFGYIHNGNAAIYPKVSQFDVWRSWVPKTEIKATSGAMFWTVEMMIALNAASPSGIVTFPEFIDASQPVVMRDLKNPNWVGLFMPNRVDDNGKPYTADPATLPSWWNV